MNAEEVRKMIDTIYAGEHFPLVISEREGASKTLFEFNESAIRITSCFENSWPTEIRDPRTARELAGALVAWASRQEMQNKLNDNLNRIIGGE